MATGRYVLKNVPIWTEQFALFCLVWFSMLSVSLAVKDDSHIRMELLDYFLPEKHIWIFEYFAYIVALVFSLYMITNGVFLMELSKGVQMSGMRISESYLYLSLPVAGFCTAYMALYRIIAKLLGGRHGS
jgi:TRAP-type C4-dicarboxylate transport system permease small subunit